jgi:hypothetical protein
MDSTATRIPSWALQAESLTVKRATKEADIAGVAVSI